MNEQDVFDRTKDAYLCLIHPSQGDGPEDGLAMNRIQTPFEAVFPAEARS